MFKPTNPMHLAALLCLAASPLLAADSGEASFTRQEDVIYGRKSGVALTMDVFTPKQNAQGAAVIQVVSGGWFSAHASINPGALQEFLKRGYTVFSVVHGSQPKFTIPEIVQDLQRATRYIRAHAKDYQIDADRIGIYGGSAGGHLSLMQGTAGDLGDPQAKDPIDRVSSRVQAVGCFFPPTDFLNYGKEGENALGRGVLANFKAAFDFHEYDKKAFAFMPVTDEAKVLELGRKISPVTHATSDDPPTLIIHGDADKLVPIQQAEILIKKLQATGVEAKLVVKPGAAHGWADMNKDLVQIADWFDAHLNKSKASGGASGLAQLVGRWKVILKFGEDERDYELKLSDTDGKPGAIMISPRSGEYKCKTASWKNGELLLELDREIEGNAVTLVYKGKLADGKLSGSFAAKGQEDQFSGTWKAER